MSDCERLEQRYNCLSHERDLLMDAIRRHGGVFEGGIALDKLGERFTPDTYFRIGVAKDWYVFFPRANLSRAQADVLLQRHDEVCNDMFDTRKKLNAAKDVL